MNGVPGLCTICGNSGKLYDCLVRRTGTRVPRFWRRICDQCVAWGKSQRIIAIEGSGKLENYVMNQEAASFLFAQREKKK